MVTSLIDTLGRGEYGLLLFRVAVGLDLPAFSSLDFHYG